MEPPLKLGCYSALWEKNCVCNHLPSGLCEEGTGPGREAADMDFFASVGYDYFMIDMPDRNRRGARYQAVGDGIRSSSNPHMLFGVWTGPYGYS